MAGKIHLIKCWPEFFQAVLDGTKGFEVRLDDRRYAVGDVLRIQEYDDKGGVLTGRECQRKVTFLLRGGNAGVIPPLQGIRQNYVVMSLAKHDGGPK